MRRKGSETKKAATMLSLCWSLFCALAGFSFASTPEPNEPGNLELQATFERSLHYLENYHNDFASICFEVEVLPSSNHYQIDILDASGTLLKSFTVSTTDDFQRTVFHELATLLLNADTSRVSQASIEALEAAWYWDAGAIGNPAVFDWLDDDSTDTDLNQRKAFWRYRLLMQQYGGRSRLWKQIKSQPNLVEILDPVFPLSRENTLQLLELKQYKLSPVDNLLESQNLLHALRSFRLVNSETKKLQWVSIEQLPKEKLENPLLLKEISHRLSLIKSCLTSANPLFLNSFQSLGVCFERLIDQDSSGYEAALHRFLQDARFTQEVQDEIRNRKRRNTGSP